MEASTSRVAVVKSRLPIAAALLAQILRLIVDLGSEERHHPVENPQLKEYKAKLTVTGAVINSTLLSDPTARSSARTSRSFSRRLNDHPCGDLPHPFGFCRS